MKWVFGLEPISRIIQKVPHAFIHGRARVLY